jgi:uncharacterized protein YfaS (alpha-2-macroglobulin family)
MRADWYGTDVRPDMADVLLEKTGSGPAWGALYLQYWSSHDAAPAFHTPLVVERQFLVHRRGALEPVVAGGALKVGERLTVRLTIRADRTMDYVHLADNRASGFEPVDVFSGFRWTGSAGYYESTRDSGSHFFFHRLSAGVHVLEYDLHVSQPGDFSAGFAQIQSMYAPEFAGRSAGMRILVP